MAPAEALRNMVTGDPLAIFGGVVMTTFVITKPLAWILLHHGMPEGQRRRLDCICAPGFTPEAQQLLERRGGKCRLITNKKLGHTDDKGPLLPLDAVKRVRYVRGGFLMQPNYTYVLDLEDPELERTKHFGSYASARDFLLAWAICATSNSNTVTLVKGGALIGNGVGRQDRVGGCELALRLVERAGHDVAGAVAYSDSFFPFSDGPELLVEAGVRIIGATRGSVRDAEVRGVCEKHKVTLVWMPDRSGRGFYGH
jgi:phosphoribosylaminoimidazolecarboxamide formyltransferase/IMP cyclohydrolase